MFPVPVMSARIVMSSGVEGRRFGSGSDASNAQKSRSHHPWCLRPSEPARQAPFRVMRDEAR
jgi:hypothetical protein